MPTFQEALRVAELTVEDKTSAKRSLEILKILRQHKVAHGLTPEKAVAVLEDLGPTFVKIGQLASNRGDLLPKEYCDAFAQLRDHSTPLPFDEITRCLDESYGAPWTTVFESIDEKPLGSASIAQAHRATLLDGTEVAVKVRRPGVVESMASDIMLMKHLVALAEFTVNSHESLMLTLDGFVNELERTTENEVDFTIELNNLVRFKKELEDQPKVTCPTPYPDHSNESVLVMEFVRGDEVDKLEDFKAHGLTRKSLASRLAQSYVSQMLDSGFFHADPHPGNIIIRGDEIVWIDLGMTGYLTGSDRSKVKGIFRGLATQNAYEIKESVLGLVTPHGEVNHGALLDALNGVLDSYGSAELGDIDAGNVFQDVIDILRTQNLVLKPSVSMLARGVLTIEGLLADLCPEISITSIVTKHVIADSLKPEALARQANSLFTSSAEAVEAMTRLPSLAANALDMMERGQMVIKTDMNVPEGTRGTLYTIAGRLSLAVISVGLFLGSSILCTTDMQPRILEVPVFGFLGFIAAVVLSGYVIWRSLAERHEMRNNEQVK